ncbi:MAG: 23S rRNA (adenine(2503)-C(2))-methyltransferase RlmN [Clostridia bacterium]|nr:23S rRNA (adenine(2503)-C(2))-methyltransferase RlmN [Clostridia bacterium]
MADNGKNLDLMGLLPEELEAFCLSHGQPAYRAGQIFSFLSKGVAPGDMSNLPKDFRAVLEKETEYRLPVPEEKYVSAIDGTIKYLFRLTDGEHVESVFMRYKHGNTLCVSSEVGCPMGCAFCASTIGGKVRNLYPSEILGQIIAAEKDTGERVDGVVMMGIGEPLDNYDNVIRFLKLVGHPEGLNIGYRHISLSTCGLVPGIDKLAKEAFPITLSVSLHAVTDEKRSEIMPVNKKYPLNELLAACKRYYLTTGRRISFEYTLISGKNDSLADAKALAELLKTAFRGTGTARETDIPLHVNLIRVNEVKETPFRKGDAETVNAFAAALEKAGVTATVRRRLGSDIDAACGQLRRNRKDSSYPHV